MQILDPTILEDARQLSPKVTSIALALGTAVWLFGWRGHRFWIVLTATAGAGILGIYSAAALGNQPLMTGLLLAVTSGLLALALVRVFAFAAGGCAAWFLARALLLPWQEPLLFFLCGGLIGLLLFRLWTIALTSTAGSLLILYAGLSLADHLGKLDAIALATNDPAILNSVCGGLAFLGIVLQLLFDRWRTRAQKAKSLEADEEQRQAREFSRASRPYRQAG